MTFALAVVPIVLLLLGFPIFMVLLTAVTVACLTVYDMVKAADRAMTIEAVRLVHKSGGRSGEYSARSPSD